MVKSLRLFEIRDLVCRQLVCSLVNAVTNNSVSLEGAFIDRYVNWDAHCTAPPPPAFASIWIRHYAPTAYVASPVTRGAESF